jgi:hypothetical protein
MNRPDEFAEKFRQMEQEVYRSAGLEPPLKSADPQAQSGGIRGIYNWVSNLSGIAKVVAVVVIGMIAFAIISFVLKLLWAAFTLAMLAIIVYVLYKVFFAPTPTPLE